MSIFLPIWLVDYSIVNSFFATLVVMDVFDILFPKRCVACKKFGGYLCADCFTQISFDVESICLVCNSRAIDGITHPRCRGKYTIDGSLASVVYKGMMKRLIAAFKFKPYVSDLQNVLTDFFYEGLIQQEQFARILKTESVFVPIPLHRDRQLKRSYNQAEFLAKSLGKRLQIPTKKLLTRSKNTRNQFVLTREERKENIKGAFEINKKELHSFRDTKFHSLRKVDNSLSLQLWGSGSPVQVILVDDVITSGTTIVEAANVLKRQGVKSVWGIALAHGK